MELAKVRAINASTHDANILSSAPYFSDMVALYNQGDGVTYRDLAQEFNVISYLGLEGKSDDPLLLAESIVGIALRPLDNSERRSLAQANSLANLVHGQGRFARLDMDELITTSHAGVLARGRRPYTSNENSRLLALTEQSSYQGIRGGPNYAKIGEVIGRSESSVRSQYQRLMKSGK